MDDVGDAVGMAKKIHEHRKGDYALLECVTDHVIRCLAPSKSEFKEAEDSMPESAWEAREPLKHAKSRRIRERPIRFG